MVGFRGSVKRDTEAGSGMVLMPPSLTFILCSLRNQSRAKIVEKTHFRQTLAKYWGFAREHLWLFMH
jgi:hypothetical protein